MTDQPRTLPRKSLPTDVVTIDGQDVTVRGLSRSEALHLTTAFRPTTESELGDVDGAEVFILMKGAGVSEEEAIAFRDEVDGLTAGLLIDRIVELSDLVDLTGKSPDPKSGGSGRS